MFEEFLSAGVYVVCMGISAFFPTHFSKEKDLERQKQISMQHMTEDFSLKAVV